jgi:hypothetical protein
MTQTLAKGHHHHYRSFSRLLPPLRCLEKSPKSAHAHWVVGKCRTFRNDNARFPNCGISQPPKFGSAYTQACHQVKLSLLIHVVIGQLGAIKKKTFKNCMFSFRKIGLSFVVIIIINPN